jgi:hypothetical protein
MDSIFKLGAILVEFLPAIVCAAKSRSSTSVDVHPAVRTPVSSLFRLLKRHTLNSVSTQQPNSDKI